MATLFRTRVLIADMDDFSQMEGLMDTVSCNGGLWLVYKWTAASTPGFRTPIRAIRMDVLRYQRCAAPGADYELLDPMPKGVLDGSAELQEMQKYVVAEDLPFEILIPSRN